VTSRLLPTGDPGLDEILRGGLPRGSTYLVQAPPGAGKTTLALQFLMEGARRGERGLYVTLSQTKAELHGISASHGWDLAGIEVVELQRAEDPATTQQSIFQTADLRLDRTREAVEAAVTRLDPARLVYDSLLEVRLLVQEMPRYHRELMGLRAFTDPRGITVMLLDTDVGGGEVGRDVQSRGIVHGIVTIAKTLPAFGRARRRIEVTKMRGVNIHDGWHDMDIREGRGVVVFPRVVPSAGRTEDRGFPGPGAKPLVRSGVDRLDDLFGGGLEPGTTTMVVGQAGTGKSTVASLYAAAALARGERVALFLFEERLETFFRRCEGLGMELRGHVEEGRLKIFDYSPDEVSPGEFSQIVQAEAEADGLGMVVIDSLTGYMASLADEAQALFDIQSLMKFLARREILTIMIVAQRGLLGADEGGTRIDLSFLGDTVLLLRMHEDGHAVRRSIAAVKKRHGPHVTDIYELMIRPGGIAVEQPPDAPS
jgi:circadian clock protein KaiC